MGHSLKTQRVMASLDFIPGCIRAPVSRSSAPQAPSMPWLKQAGSGTASLLRPQKQGCLFTQTDQDVSHSGYREFEQTLGGHVLLMYSAAQYQHVPALPVLACQPGIRTWHARRGPCDPRLPRCKLSAVASRRRRCWATFAPLDTPSQAWLVDGEQGQLGFCSISSTAADESFLTLPSSAMLRGCACTTLCCDLQLRR